MRLFIGLAIAFVVLYLAAGFFLSYALEGIASRQPTFPERIQFAFTWGWDFVISRLINK